MRTILIPVSSNFFARNFLRTDAFHLLRESKQVHIVLLTHPSKVAYYRETFGGERVTVDALPDVRGLFSEWAFQMIELSSIVTNRAHMDQVTFLFREGETHSFSRMFMRLPLFLTKRLFRIIGYIGAPWRSLVRVVYAHYPSEHFRELFERYKPSAVFAPTMVFAEDYILLREAKRRGLATVGMVFSWDTFYSKTFLRLHPDRLFVQTGKIKEQAVHFGDFPSERIIVTGITQYDRYFKHEGIIPRNEFFKKIGADPKKKLILYAFSGKAGLGIDLDIVDILYEAIVTNEIKESVEVLLRPYPRFDFSAEKLEKLRNRYGFCGVSSTSYIGASRGEWEMDEEALSLLTNSLAHADLVITMYSTFFIEAAIFDKPLIAIAFDGYKTFDYWNSARRFFDWDHLRDVRHLGALALVENRTAFVRAVNEYLKDGSIRREGRKELVNEQCHFTDGQSGERLSQALGEFLNAIKI